MGEIIKIGNNTELEKVDDEIELVELTEELLQEARATIEKNKVLSVPISGLATLGTGVATLLPALNKLTGSNETLYRLANAAVGDSLKLAKNGNFWGSFPYSNWWLKICATSSSVTSYNFCTASCRCN